MENPRAALTRLRIATQDTLLGLGQIKEDMKKLGILEDVNAELEETLAHTEVINRHVGTRLLLECKQAQTDK